MIDKVYIKTINVKIESIKLKSDYNLAHCKLKFYHSIITEICLSNELKLYGEVTPLRGYTEETVESVTSDIEDIKKNILNKSITDSVLYLNSILTCKNSFSISSILPPLENYSNSFGFKDIAIKAQDLVYGLAIEDLTIPELEREILNINKSGYKTIKIKIGKNADHEYNIVNILSNMDIKDFKIRFDANCGYNYNETLNFLDLVSEKLPDNTEYFEQPLCRQCWKEIEKINKMGFAIPVMLDESIYSIEEIKKSFDVGIKFIKIKLCKFGGMDNLQNALEYARTLNLNVVLGNGVATDIANYFELLFYYKNKAKIFGASESVGFIKIDQVLKYDLKINNI